MAVSLVFVLLALALTVVTLVFAEQRKAVLLRLRLSMMRLLTFEVEIHGGRLNPGERDTEVD